MTIRLGAALERRRRLRCRRCGTRTGFSRRALTAASRAGGCRCRPRESAHPRPWPSQTDAHRRPLRIRPGPGRRERFAGRRPECGPDRSLMRCCISSCGNSARSAACRSAIVAVLRADSSEAARLRIASATASSRGSAPTVIVAVRSRNPVRAEVGVTVNSQRRPAISTSRVTARAASRGETGAAGLSNRSCPGLPRPRAVSGSGGRPSRTVPEVTGR